MVYFTLFELFVDNSIPLYNMIPLNPQKVLTGGVMFLCIVILGTRVNFLRFKRKSEKSVTKINDDLMIAIGEASVRGRRPTLEDEILIDLDIC